MTGYMTNDANLARHGELRRRADRHRAAHIAAPAAGPHAAAHAAPIAIRRATEAARRTVERLAALDSVATLSGEILIASVGGEPQAAIDIASGATIADPFRPTAHLVELLGLRAARMREGTRSPRRLPGLRPRRSAYRAA
jgi:hypothetical protein